MGTKRTDDELYQALLAFFKADKNITAAAGALGVPRTTLAYRLQEAAKNSKLWSQAEKELEKSRPKFPKSKIYVITAAQNATPAHLPALLSLKNYCDHRGATLVVVPFRYRNQTSQWTIAQEENNWWHKELEPYLHDDRVNLNDNLMLFGDIKMQPTASNPLSSFTSISGHRSAILAHPKLALTTVPTPGHMLPKIVTTTGAITIRNYTDTRSGKAGDFHHTIGAALVEVRDDKVFYLRQINCARDGSFIDLDLLCTPKGVRKAPRAAGLHMGDVHVKFFDPGVEKATFGKGGIIDVLNPRHLVWNDTLDFYSANHHHRSNPFVQIAKQKAGIRNVMAEVREAAEFIAFHTRSDIKNIIVASNHDEALARWVKETDWRSDPENAICYLETAVAMAKSAEIKKGQDGYVVHPFHYWLEKLLPEKVLKNTVLLRREDSFDIAGIEVGFHGDEGANGSRGSRAQFKRIGRKSIIGHGHAPGIDESCFQSGTSAILKREYISGLSGHLHAHTAIYDNGKRSLIIMINGEWKL